MAQDDMPPITALEAKIADALEGHPQLPHFREMCQAFKNVSDGLAAQGAKYDIIAAAAQANLSGMLAAQKMTGVTSLSFINLLVDDLVDTVKNRTVPGELRLQTKQ